MDIQVLNEIANPARKAVLSQLSPSVSANAQLRALKGNPVPGSPEPLTLEDSPEQNQDPVTPEISPVARAASDYSAAVGDGLNSDELSAIQDLAGRVRTAVSDFLSQPGLEQAENAAAVVVSNPEAVQDLASSVEQAVVETLNLSGPEGEFIVNAIPPNEDVLVEIPDSDDLISIERITNGAELNNEVQVIAANPALVNSRGSENINVENPVTVEKVPESSRGDFRVTTASPASQNAPADEGAPVETSASSVVVAPQESVNRSETVATEQQEVPVTASSPELQNAPANENAQVGTPASPPDVAAVPQQEPVSRPETVATNQKEAPVTVASPISQQSVPTRENTQVEAPVSRAVATPSQETVSRPETIAANSQGAPVEHPDTAPPNNQQSPVTAVNRASQNAPAHNAEVGNPVTVPASPPNQGQGLEESPAQAINSEGSTAPLAGAGNQVAPDPSSPQLESTPPQSGPVQSNDLFAQESAAVNPENIRDVNELVNSVVDNEFTSEAKKIFSEPKVIRTVADLADFILERLQEIIATKQQQPQSTGETPVS
jgi:hypothetical protein